METINLRKRESDDRIERLRSSLTSRIQAVEEPDAEPGLCIYATGSLARLEANADSDLDAFFFLTGKEEEKCLSRIRDVRILNAVVEASQDLYFPDFSNDGEYLKFLHIEDVLQHIGGRQDDYHNALTARMLLLLESKFIYNEDLYINFKRKVIERYFSDFHRHNDDFRPIFLLNDILRFWRTLCLNYENGRTWRTEDTERRAKGHLSNLKLRFSRLNICYSFIAMMLSYGPAIQQQNVEETSAATPLERLAIVQQRIPALESEISALYTEYDWFLETVGRPKDEVLDWISDKGRRIDAFSHGNKFVSSMYSVVRSVAEQNNYLRYLVI